MSLLELWWLDVLLPQILARLSLKDLFNLRCVSKDFRNLVDLHLTNLKILKIINRNRFPYEAFEVLFLCEKLTILNFSKCCFLTDDILIPLLTKNKNIVNVNLSGCKNITAKSLQPLILQCNLRVLKLARCPWLTTGAMEALVLHQHFLEEVDISYCNFSSENCLLKFIKKFHKLKILSMEGVPQVGNKCLYYISKFSLHIKHLNVAVCKRISNTGISYIASSCPKLESLAIRLCHNVNDTALIPIWKRNIMVDYRSTFYYCSKYRNTKSYFLLNINTDMNIDGSQASSFGGVKLILIMVHHKIL